MSNKLLRFTDKSVVNDSYKNSNGVYVPDYQAGLKTKVDFFNAETGERLWEPLHNKTLIAGSALNAMKVFNLDRRVLDNTPTYDTVLGLDDGNTTGMYPTKNAFDADGNPVPLTNNSDECQRKVIGFCLGQGGAGLDISDKFEEVYDSWIEPDNLVPFRYPLNAADMVDEEIYKGKKSLILPNGQERNAYYFKTFSNTPDLVQNYVSNIGTFADSINAETVYKKTTDARAQSYVEMHLKITKEEIREFFIAHTGLENAKINQLSIVSAWTITADRTKMDENGNKVTKTVELFQDIRPYSLLNIPNEIMSDLSKSISIIYTFYF